MLGGKINAICTVPFEEEYNESQKDLIRAFLNDPEITENKGWYIENKRIWQQQ
jgi:hypothetical protein